MNTQQFIKEQVKKFEETYDSNFTSRKDIIKHVRTAIAAAIEEGRRQAIEIIKQYKPHIKTHIDRQNVLAALSALQEKKLE